MKALDFISLDNIDLSNEWVCKESILLDREDISWETIEVPLSTLTLEDKTIYIDNDDYFNRNDNLLEYLVDDFPCISPQDQDSYFHVKDEDDI